MTVKQDQEINAIQVSVSGGSGSYSYSISGAPSGITISDSGRITGAPTESGEFTIRVHVQETPGGGAVGTAPPITGSRSFNMYVQGPLALSSISDVRATQDEAISDIEVSASGGQPPYTYSISGAPSGIEINSDSGLITGTPTQTGTFSLTVTVTDAEDGTASTSFTLTVPDPIPPLTLASISNVTVTEHQVINAIQVSASGGRTPYTYAISGAPSDIAISSSSGSITGIPTETGKFTVTVTVTDADNRTATESFTLTVTAPIPPLTITQIDDITVEISAVQTNSPIDPIQVSASGGQTPYTYSLASSPAEGAGLSINATSGQITGTPTKAGTFTLTVTVTDASSRTATDSFSMGVSLIGDFNGDGAVNNADFLLFSAAFGTSSGDEGYDAGLDLNGDGTINVADFLIFVDHFGGASGAVDDFLDDILGR